MTKIKQNIQGKNSIIFYLDTNLEVYELDLVKKELQLIKSIEKGNRLNLYDSFENIWKELWSKISTSQKNYLIVGPNAGFTNSRVVFSWLKASEVFDNLDYGVVKTGLSLDFAKVGLTNLFDLLESSQHLLEYSQEPRIGT